MSAPATLPDLFRGGLDVVFVGINPSVFSATQGHYFARKINRFWPAFSRSRLSLRARAGLGVERLEPVHDRALQDYGFGFTDLVKRPSPRSTDLTRAEPIDGVAALARKLKRHKPRFACFHGVTVGRPVQKAIAPQYTGNWTRSATIYDWRDPHLRGTESQPGQCAFHAGGSDLLV